MPDAAAPLEVTALVKAASPDRYISTLFAPDAMRPHLLALYAFDAEIARIPGIVSEPQLGEIRLQWWLDTLDAIFDGNTVDHPLGQGLAAAISQGQLPRPALRQLVEARSRDLYADPMPSLNELEGYLGETESTVFHMAAQILLSGQKANLSDVAGLGGVAHGIAALLARLPALPHGGRNLLPDTPDTQGLIAHGEKRLTEARALQSGIPEQAFPAFLPLATVAARLQKLARKGTGERISPLRSQWLIWRSARNRRF